MYPEDKNIMYSEYFSNCNNEEEVENFIDNDEKKEIRMNAMNKLHDGSVKNLINRLSTADNYMDKKESDVEEEFVNSEGLLERFLKYFIEGIAVALVGFVLVFSKKGKFNFNRQGKDILVMGLTAAVVFGVLDMYAPAISGSARQGAGFGLGANLVGFPLLR